MGALPPGTPARGETVPKKYDTMLKAGTPDRVVKYLMVAQDGMSIEEAEERLEHRERMKLASG